MLAHVREKDLELFIDMSREPRPATPEATPMATLIPAFMISELRRAFEIGFMLYIPFLIIDLVVASILMSMGMMMLPPVTVALPFKLIFFVLVDGWNLVAGSLVQSYGGGCSWLRQPGPWAAQPDGGGAGGLLGLQASEPARVARLAPATRSPGRPVFARGRGGASG